MSRVSAAGLRAETPRKVRTLSLFAEPSAGESSRVGTAGSARDTHAASHRGPPGVGREAIGDSCVKAAATFQQDVPSEAQIVLTAAAAF